MISATSTGDYITFKSPTPFIELEIVFNDPEAYISSYFEWRNRAVPQPIWHSGNDWDSNNGGFGPQGFTLRHIYPN